MANSKGKLWTQLRQEMKDAKFTDGQIEYARQLTHDYNHNYIKDYAEGYDLKKQVNLDLENLTDEELDKYGTLEMNDYYEKVKYLKDKIEKNADRRKVALVNHDPVRAKTSTEKDKEPGKSESYYAVCDQESDAEEYYTLIQKAIVKFYDNPPHNATSVQDIENAEKIRSFGRIIKPFNQFLKSCLDEKYSFSLMKHAEMMRNVETVSKHGAAVKAAIQVMRDGVLTDEWRKMTRERASDEFEEMLKWLQDFTASFPDILFWAGYMDWRDRYSTLNNRIAARKVDLEDEFSEKAIG